MRAAKVTAKARVELVDVPDPVPGPAEVLVRIRQCGICGSDLHVYRGEWSIETKVGHEICGVVERRGEGATRLAEGTRVCAECFSHCGKCRSCVAGDYNLCESILFLPGLEHSGLAEKAVLPAHALFRVPESFSDAEAMMLEPLAVAFRAVSRAGVGPEARVGIIGAGTIGLLCAAAARAAGASRIVIAARHAHQAALATKLGADDAVLVGQKDYTQAMRESGGLDAVIDAAASGTSFSAALSVARNHGRVVLVGGITRPMLVSLSPLQKRELKVTGSECYGLTKGKPDFAHAIELIQSGRVNAGRLVTHTVPFENVDEAFRTASDKSTGSIKVAVRMAD